MDFSKVLAEEAGLIAKASGATPEQIREHEIKTRRMSLGQTPSRRWDKLKMIEMRAHAPGGPVRIWKNDLYTVTERRYLNGWPIGDGPWATLGIWTNDGNARHDWRDFQRVKNDIMGDDWEALELYPAEKRLLDPSNYYMLYAAPSLPFGKFEPRTILGPENCIAPQRGWAKGDEPPELRNPKG